MYFCLRWRVQTRLKRFLFLSTTFLFWSDTFPLDACWRRLLTDGVRTFDSCCSLPAGGWCPVWAAVCSPNICIISVLVFSLSRCCSPVRQFVLREGTVNCEETLDVCVWDDVSVKVRSVCDYLFFWSQDRNRYSLISTWHVLFPELETSRSVSSDTVRPCFFQNHSRSQNNYSVILLCVDHQMSFVWSK